MFALENSHKADLIRATLTTLHAYLSWVPLGYIFEVRAEPLHSTHAFSSLLSHYITHNSHSFPFIRARWWASC